MSKGMIWPPSIAPFEVHLVVIGDAGSSSCAVAEELAQTLSERAECRCCWTTGTPAPGCKFADAELIGAPVRLTVGKRTVSEGTVDVQARRGREQSSTDVKDAADRALGLLREGATDGS